MSVHSNSATMDRESAKENNVQNLPHGIDFCTLGMFIIDEIYPSPEAQDQTIHVDILGGAGTYAAIGARLLSPAATSSSSSKSIGWIIDTGTDFPSKARDQISAWNTSVLFRKRDAPTTRGWNGYSGKNEHRAFKYLTAKKRLTADDLPPSSSSSSSSSSSIIPSSSPGDVEQDSNYIIPPLLASRSFHIICSPTRCVSLCTRILERRKQILGENTLLPRPVIVWEPVPDLCLPSELENLYAALPHVDVVSPNHEELGMLFGTSHPVSGPIDRVAVETQVRALLEHGGDGSSGTSNDGESRPKDRHLAVVVRAGREGCLVATGQKRVWLPAYHTDSTHVIDPTGGGNGFLGAFAVGLVRTNGDLVEAARWGNVAASLCIEQVGVPFLDPGAGYEMERWNGVNVFERLELYRQRTL